MAIWLLAFLCFIAPNAAFGGGEGTRLPKDICVEIDQSLQMGVKEGYLTQEEALWIYEGCGRWQERDGKV